MNLPGMDEVIRAAGRARERRPTTLCPMSEATSMNLPGMDEVIRAVR